MIRWMLETKQDIGSRNIWPRIEVTEHVEMTTIPVHQWMELEQELHSKVGKYWHLAAVETIPNSITASLYTTVIR
jgi:hypothetical protein